MARIARHFVGIDLHRTVVQVCVVDGDGEVVAERRWRLEGPGGEGRVLRGLETWREGGRYVVEALGLNRWLVNGMRARGMEVVVADPVKLGLKALGKKTDRRDARELARRLRLGDIDRCAATHYPEDAEYGVRALLRGRRKLVGIRTQLVNQARAVVNAYRLEAPRGKLYGAKGLAWLQACRVPTQELEVWVRALGKALEGIQAQVEAVETRLGHVAKQGLRGLETQTGVGAVTGVALVYELGDVGRFRNARTVASYVGLVPRVSQSADHAHHGRLTRRGNAELRFLLGQWAVRLLARDPRVQAWAGPHLKRMHRNKVRTALARRLLVGVAASWRRQEPFDLERCLAL